VGNDNLSNIFEPFFRSKSSRNTNGQGLGLFIARGFVEAFDGSIEASSPHAGGPGLEISITLPLVRVEVEDVVNG
jgi:two-component system sensor histidine kinase KdpD